MKLKTISASLTLLAALSLTACASAPVTGAPVQEHADGAGTLVVYTLAVEEGKLLDCVASTYSSGIIVPDCNWDNLRSGSPEEATAGSLQLYNITLPTGEEVSCVGSVYSRNRIAPDCNWSQPGNL